MTDNPHRTTLQPFLDLHRADLADQHEQADLLREMLRRNRDMPGRQPSDDSPKPPPSRTALRHDLAAIERTIAKHKQIISLACDDRVTELLHAVACNMELAREAVADPRAFAARHGLDLPETLVIDARVNGKGVSARFVNLDSDLPFEITWTEDGFPAPPQPAQSICASVAESA